MNRRKLCALALSLVILLLSAGVTLAGARTARSGDYALKVEAARRMESCLEQIRRYKDELGLGESPEDLHHSGIIGLPFTGITTTSGAIEAKRTAASPTMASLMVQLLEEAGVRPGDRVGAGFSGSFPGLDLAVLAACETMGVEIVYIPSVGASTYGANWPELTFPDIAVRLVRDGLLSTPPAAYSYGGSGDCGRDMEPALLAAVSGRMERAGIPLLYEEDFQENLRIRMELYGEIDCFLGVGGNLTTSGLGERELGYGLLTRLKQGLPDEGSGLVERYCARGIPVIHLLNLKRLMADYGLPYDPETPPVPGEGPLFRQQTYPKLPGAVGLALCWAVLWRGFRRKEERHETAG